MARTTPQPPGRYSLLGLLAGDQYEAGLADISAARYGAPQLRGQALPTIQLARDLGVAAATSGGNLVATELERVANAVRPLLTLDALGAQRIESSGSELALPRFDGGVGSWLGEGDQAAGLSTTIESAQASARCAAARLALSRRVKNANRSDVEGAVLAEIERAVRSTVEAGFIAGTGSENQPLGIVRAATGRKTYAGATPTWGELADQVAILGDANADLTNASWLLHPSDLAALLANLISADGGETIVSWADGHHRIAGFPVSVSTNVPEGTHLFADFSTVTQIYFGAPQIIDDRFSNGKSISGASELIVMNFCDVVLRNPEHVVVGTA